jgi:hypothetical protein
MVAVETLDVELQGAWFTSEGKLRKGDVFCFPKVNLIPRHFNIGRVRLKSMNVLCAVGQPVCDGSNICANVKDDVLFGEQRFNHIKPVGRINGEVFPQRPPESLAFKNRPQETPLRIVNVNHQLGLFDPSLDDRFRDVSGVDSPRESKAEAQGSIWKRTLEPHELPLCRSLLQRIHPLNVMNECTWINSGRVG